MAVLFVVSAFSKSRNPVAFREFRHAMGALAPWTAPASMWSAAGVAAFEWVAVILLAAPWSLAGMVAAGFGVAAMLLVVFSAMLVGAIRRGATVGCRCFGSTTRPVRGVHVLRNMLALAVAMLGLVMLDVARGATGAPEGIAVGVVAGLVVGVLLVSLDELVDLFVDQPVGAPQTTAPRLRR
jgi:hypothetical protein